MKLTDKQFHRLVNKVAKEIDGDCGYEEVCAVAMDFGHEASTAHEVAIELGRRPIK